MDLLEYLVMDNVDFLLLTGIAAAIALIAALAAWSRLLSLEQRLREQHRRLSDRLGRLEQISARQVSPDAVPSSPSPSQQTRPFSSKAPVEPPAPPRSAPCADETPEPLPEPTPPAAPLTPEPTPVAPLPAMISAKTVESVPREPEASAKATLEERLGTKVFIWIGGIALVLAGTFLVKYSFDNALLPPNVRVLIGAVFGLVLLGGGEYMRKRSSRVAEALTGAGIADLFGCLLAATSLYHLIGPSVGFVLMALVTALAVILSLRHGPFVALLGLIGGFATPPLIGGDSSVTLPLLVYLLLVEAGMMMVSRRRGWVGLTGLTLAGSLLWGVVLAVTGDHAAGHLLLDAFLIGSAAVYVLGATGLAAAEPPSAGNGLTPLRIAMTGLGAVIVFVGVLVQGHFDLVDSFMMGLLGAGVLVLARLRPMYGPTAWLAGAVSGLTLIAWAIQSLWGHDASPTEIHQFMGFVAGFGILYAGGSYLALWRSSHAARWAAGAAAAGVGYVLIARIGLLDAPLPGGLEWWHVGALLTVVYGMGTALIRQRRARVARSEQALAAMTVGSATLAAMTMAMGLDYPWMVSGWAILVALLAGINAYERIDGLSIFNLVLASLTTAAAIVPGPAMISYGATPVFNRLFLAYAIPSAALGVAAWLGQRETAAAVSGVIRLLALIVGAFGMLVLVRHGFHPKDVFTQSLGLYEWATYATVLLVLAHALFVWDRWRSGWPQRGMAATCAAMGGVAAICGVGLIANPLWHSYSVGAWPVLNGLLYLFGLPAVLIALLALPAQRASQTSLRLVVGLASLLLLFALVSLQVRQGFVGPVLTAAPVSMAEWYTYSLAWIVLGVTLVLAGIRFDSRALRYGSLIIMLLAIGKVFILDTARLDDLYRVLSLFGLGLSLLALGYLYQRFVFRRPAQSSGDKPAAKPES